jgi:hypothetical protein
VSAMRVVTRSLYLASKARKEEAKYNGNERGNIIPEAVHVV